MIRMGLGEKTASPLCRDGADVQYAILKQKPYNFHYKVNAQHCGGERELECDGYASACRAAGAVRLVRRGWCGLTHVE